jgi:hypothetical protein
MKYSSDRVGAMSWMRKGMIGTPLLTARSTSRRICGESLAFAEKIRMSTRQWLMPSIIASPHSAPGTMSRGAIQHRIPDPSSAAQVASAAALSWVE